MSTVRRERRNWLIHRLYVRKEHEKCLEVIETQLSECNGLCEYALFVKGLIRRLEGKVQESLQLFQAATVINPHNVENLKQVGRSLILLGKHRQAIEVYNEAERLKEEDWEIWHNKGLAFAGLKMYENAEDSFQRANLIQRYEVSYMQLGRVLTLQEKFDEALEVYMEALEFAPEHTDLLTTIGLLFLRKGDTSQAFEYLGNALTYDARNPKAILAAGSIIQDHRDMDVALSKYRVAMQTTPNSAQLWNNVGMCFFGKKDLITAATCLKRALFLSPFEWIVSYNLGLVYLHMKQLASAFHYFSAAINMKPDFGSSYMFLAITLAQLGDFENACSAYERAIHMEADPSFRLNYAITLYNHGEEEAARDQFSEFERLFAQLDEESRHSDPDVLKARTLLSRVFPGIVRQ